MNGFLNHLTIKRFALKTLALAVATGGLLPHILHAAPTGGVVVDGAGSINQSGANTQINQGSQRLSLQWDTFNVGANERVEFIQPGSDAIALNRILDNNGSQILGRIDANGHVVLVNPNGVLFGPNATINVGGLVAAGLDIDSSDFMNGELVFSAIGGSTGTVINRGLINAASGGNVALLGKSVANHGLISAELGHVALAAGSEAVVTFDGSGLIGVRIDSETLASEVGTAYAVNNSGTIEARGGKILLNASVSADLFSEAVNHGGLNGTTEAIVHDDGSFSLGGGNNVINSGTLEVSSSDGDAGYVVLAGDVVEHRGTIEANAEGDNLAGQVYLESTTQTRLPGPSRTNATADTVSGKVRVNSDNILANPGAAVTTSGHTFITGYTSIRTPGLDTEHLRIATLGSVRQAGAAQVSGNTHLYTASDASVQLTNNANDFNTLSADTGYISAVTVTDANDLSLGEISLQDSSLRLTALADGATIDQLPGSHLGIGASTLYMTADNIALGAGGATTRMYMGTMQLTFNSSIATRGSITLQPLDESIPANSARILARDRETNEIYLDLRGDTAIDLDASVTDYTRTDIESMTGRTATLRGPVMETYQTGPITLSGALTWNSYLAFLTNPDNDIAVLQGTGGTAFGGLTYVDSNDLILRNLVTDVEVSLDIASVGAGATLSQANNTTVDADFVTLSADNVLLGGNGTGRMNGGFVLNIAFGDTLAFNGPWRVDTYASQGPFLTITGDDTDNQLIFGPQATNTSFNPGGFSATIDIDLGGGNDTATFNSAFLTDYDPEFWSLARLDMGAGNDQVVFNQSVLIPLVLGAGSDVLTVGNAAVQYELVDFDGSEDQLVTP